MAQTRKDEIDRALREAALACFAEAGFTATTVAQIARRAGVSTGNVYRYYASKDALFAAVVPDTLARRLVAALQARVRALEGVADVAQLPPDADFHRATADLMTLCVQRRLEVAVLLARAEGTPHAGLPEQVVDMLVAGTLAHFDAPALPASQVFVLRALYRDLLDTVAALLLRFEEEDALLRAAHALSRYHLAGLSAFFS